MCINVVRSCYCKRLCVIMFLLLWCSNARSAAHFGWVALEDVAKTIEATTPIMPVVISLILEYVPGKKRWVCRAKKDNPSNWGGMSYRYQGNSPCIKLHSSQEQSVVLDANTFALCDVKNGKKLQKAFLTGLLNPKKPHSEPMWPAGRNSSDKHILVQSRYCADYTIYTKTPEPEKVAFMRENPFGVWPITQLLDDNKIIYQDTNKSSNEPGIYMRTLLVKNFLKNGSTPKVWIKLPDNEGIVNFVVSPDSTAIFLLTTLALYRWNKVRCYEVTES